MQKNKYPQIPPQREPPAPPFPIYFLYISYIYLISKYKNDIRYI